MKAILRNYGGKNCVVKDITIDDKAQFICEGNVVKETLVLTLIDKMDTNFVRCKACNELVPNNKKDIKAHVERSVSHEGCYGCPWVRVQTLHDDRNKTKYVLDENGKFKRSVNDIVNLTCGYSWRGTNITADSCRNNCMYRSCNADSIESVKTFFDKYPNAFDNMITVDAIKDFKEIKNNGTDTLLKMKCRGTIHAVADANGIVHYFRVVSRHSIIDVFYSKKYNKLFVENSGKYIEFVPNWAFSADKIDYIQRTIAKMYN